MAERCASSPVIVEGLSMPARLAGETMTVPSPESGGRRVRSGGPS